MQALEDNFLEFCSMYFFAMKNMFNKTPVELPKPHSPREKYQSLLYDIGVGWYMRKLSEKLPPLKKSKLSKKSQEKEDEIKRNLQASNQYWNDWKFHIHWNKLEWVNPRYNNELKNHFFVSSNFFFER